MKQVKPDMGSGAWLALATGLRPGDGEGPSLAPGLGLGEGDPLPLAPALTAGDAEPEGAGLPLPDGLPPGPPGEAASETCNEQQMKSAQ